MMQRQLQLLWTFKMRIGMDVSPEARDGAASSSWSRGTTHSLSADAKIAAQKLFGLRD
jgi:hypothetical protein